jgi:RNA recognition motif-containing protein
VYVRNLEESIKIDQMKEALTELFSEYGEIIDIVAKNNLKAKGQAFIVFHSVESAEKAIEEIQGFELFEKPMQLAFAKTRSDATVKRSGDEEEFELHKRRRLAEKGMTGSLNPILLTCTDYHLQTRRKLLKLRKRQRDRRCLPPLPVLSLILLLGQLRLLEVPA